VAGAPGNDAMCGLIEQQIALLAQQLALMRSGGPAPAAPVAGEAAPEPVDATPAREARPPAVQAVLALMDAARPPVPGARIGRDPDGRPAWFVPNPRRRGHFLKVGA
jgi:hypothetical protein